MNCRWPHCPIAVRCGECGAQLCTVQSHDTHQITGHFVETDVQGNQHIICVPCHGKSEKKATWPS